MRRLRFGDGGLPDRDRPPASALRASPKFKLSKGWLSDCVPEGTASEETLRRRLRGLTWELMGCVAEGVPAPVLALAPKLE